MKAAVNTVVITTPNAHSLTAILFFANYSFVIQFEMLMFHFTGNDKMVYRDPKYISHSPKDLLDFSFWSHFRPFIQRHGRVTTYKKKKKQSGDGENEENGDEEEDEEEEVMKAKLITILCCILYFFLHFISYIFCCCCRALQFNSSTYGCRQ